MTLQLRYAAHSDVGRVRKDNQDSGYAGAHLLAVADGVGGAARGDLSSSVAIAQLRRLDQPPGNDLLEQVAGAVHLTHDKLADLVAESPEIEGTSTTVTAALFDGARIGLVHVGDSRAYLLREGSIRRLTKDHTFVQSLVDDGRITEEEARVHPHRNLILKAVDGVHEPEPDASIVDLQEGDRLLLCSDGCCGVLDDAELTRLLGDGDLDYAGSQLIRASLEAGSSDNITVVLGELVTTDEPGAAEPLVVGAAAGSDRRGLSRPGLLRRRSEPVEEVVDPEALRYAPRPPRRLLWVRRLAVAVVVLLLLCLAGFGAYRWTQSQYYVGVSGEHVAIYRGVEAKLPGLRMHSLLERTDLALESLPEHNALAVRDGIGADSLGRARSIVANLRIQACPRTLQQPNAENPARKKDRNQTDRQRRRDRAGPTSKPTSPPTKRHRTNSTPSTPMPTIPEGADCSGATR